MLYEGLVSYPLYSPFPCSDAEMSTKTSCFLTSLVSLPFMIDMDVSWGCVKSRIYPQHYLPLLCFYLDSSHSWVAEMSTKTMHSPAHTFNCTNNFIFIFYYFFFYFIYLFMFYFIYLLFIFLLFSVRLWWGWGSWKVAFFHIFFYFPKKMPKKSQLIWYLNYIWLLKVSFPYGLFFSDFTMTLELMSDILWVILYIHFFFQFVFLFLYK